MVLDCYNTRLALALIICFAKIITCFLIFLIRLFPWNAPVLLRTSTVRESRGGGVDVAFLSVAGDSMWHTTSCYLTLPFCFIVNLLRSGTSIGRLR